MKKTLLLLAVIAGFAVSAQKASAETVYPKIYINPGHGSWTANDRPMNTIKHGVNNALYDANNDTTNFFESNTNLRKAFALLDQLVEYGVPFDRTKNQENTDPSRVGAALDLTQTNIVMSHVRAGAWPAYLTPGNKNTANPDNSKYNRTLSVIAKEAEDWGADMFISIHSNAATEGTDTNYLYFAWDNSETVGEDFTMSSITTKGKEIRDLSIEMSKKGWDHRILDRHQMWTHYDCKVGDGTVKIGYQNLGVLNHSVPGYLVEGYFHTYQPARHRYMNPQVCRIEGQDYARGVADYFGWTKENTGDIYGIVRDKKVKFTHEYYTPRSGTNDEYKPLNNVTVTLKQGETVIATTTTDDEWNGAFVFNDVAPGSYTLEFSHSDYHNYVEGSLSSIIHTKSPTSLPVTVEAAKTTYPTAFLLNKDSEPEIYVVYENYPDKFSDTGIDINTAVTFSVENISPLADAIASKTVRRTILRDDKLYVLALDDANEPYIYLVDITANKVTELDKAAVVMGANGRLKISDIALTADGVLIANGMSKTQFNDSYVESGEVRGSVNFYKWTVNASTGLPETCEVWFTTQYACNYYRCVFGKTIAYSGTLNSGIITVHSVNGSQNKEDVPLLAQITIANGGYSTVVRNTTNIPTSFKPSSLSSNEDYLLYVSPLDDKNCVLDGNKVAPMEWTFGSAETPTVNGTTSAVNVKANGVSFFKMGGKSYMVSPAINSNGRATGVELYDVTNGFSNATLVKTQSVATPAEYDYVAAHAHVIPNEDNTEAEVKLYLIAEKKGAEGGGDEPDPEDPEISGDEETVTVYPDPVAEELPDVELGSTHELEANGSATISELSGKTIRRTILRGDYMYVLAIDNSNTPYIYAINVYDFTVTEISTSGAVAPSNADGLKISDIALTADNHLMACNYDWTPLNSTTTYTYIYYWNNDDTGLPTGNPIEWYKSNMSGLCNNSMSGASMSYSGTLTDGTALVSSDHLSSGTISGKFRIMRFTKEGGTLIKEVPASASQVTNVYGNLDIIYHNTYGSKYKFCTSPVNEDNFIMDGIKKGATELSYSGLELKADFTVVASETKVDASVTNTSYFKYAGSALMAAPVVANGQCTGVQILDVSNGLNSATVVSTMAVDADATALDDVHTCGRSFVDGTDGKIDLFVLRGDYIERFTTKSTLVGVEEIDADSNAPVEYYNLQGVRVMNPSNGIFIKKQGHKTIKVIL